MKLYDVNCYIIDKIVGIYHDSSCSLDKLLKENVLLIGIKTCLISHRPLKHSTQLAPDLPNSWQLGDAKFILTKTEFPFLAFYQVASC